MNFFAKIVIIFLLIIAFLYYENRTYFNLTGGGPAKLPLIIPSGLAAIVSIIINIVQGKDPFSELNNFKQQASQTTNEGLIISAVTAGSSSMSSLSSFTSIISSICCLFSAVFVIIVLFIVSGDGESLIQTLPQMARVGA